MFRSRLTPWHSFGFLGTMACVGSEIVLNAPLNSRPLRLGKILAVTAVVSALVGGCQTAAQRAAQERFRHYEDFRALAQTTVVDASDGISEIEAFRIGLDRFATYGTACGMASLPDDAGDFWRIATAVGFFGLPREEIIIRKRDGAIAIKDLRSPRTPPLPAAASKGSSNPNKQDDVVTLIPFDDTFSWHSYHLTHANPISADGRLRFVSVSKAGDVELVYVGSGERISIKHAATENEIVVSTRPMRVTGFDFATQSADFEWLTTN